MPRWLIIALVIAVSLALVPFVFIARARATKSEQPRVHLLFDMAQQPKYKAQAPSLLFADGRAMRPAVEGTVARSDPVDSPAYNRGIQSERWTGQEPPWVTTLPVPVTAEIIHRGQQRFNIFCAPCHGWTGEGNGPVARRADELQEGTWTPPTSYHTDQLRSRPVGHIFNTITNGIRTMPAYGTQVPVADRWAIVAYVRALQRSRNARIDDVPPDMKPRLR